MGSKAKALIGEAKTSIANINRTLNTVAGNFQGVCNTKTLKKETLSKFIAYCQKKYPGTTDVGKHYSTDATIKAYVDDIVKKKNTIRGYKTDCAVALKLLDSEMKNARNALAKLDKMIIAKQQKRDKAKGLKKLAAKAKTKSLGDLRKSKAQIDKVLGQANRETLGVKAYFKKIGW